MSGIVHNSWHKWFVYQGIKSQGYCKDIRAWQLHILIGQLLHAQKSVLNHIQSNLYLHFSYWCGTKRNFVCCQINWKSVFTIQIWFDLTRFRKYFSIGVLRPRYTPPVFAKICDGASNLRLFYKPNLEITSLISRMTTGFLFTASFPQQTFVMLTKRLH